MKLSNIERSVNRNRSAIIILEGLMRGLTITLEGNRYVLATTQNGGYQLCMIARENDIEDVVLGSPMDIGTFISYCEKLPEEEISFIVANLVLNDKNNTLDN